MPKTYIVTTEDGKKYRIQTSDEDAGVTVSPYTVPSGPYNPPTTPDQAKAGVFNQSTLASGADKDKRALLEGAGEFIGGTAGAMAGGGWLSVPGAGAGAVFGKKTGSAIANAMGLPPSPDAPKTAMDELKQTGETFALNAAGEGVGRAIPTAYRAGKTVVKNVARKLAPRESRDIYNLARSMNVPVTAPMVNGLARGTQQILEKIPTARGPIAKMKLAQQMPWESNLNRIAGEYFPLAQTPEEAGLALKEGQQLNRARGTAYFENQYKSPTEQLKNSRIDVSDLKGAAIELRNQLSPETEAAFPNNVRRMLDQFAGIGEGQGEKSFAAAATAGTPASKELDALSLKFTNKEYARLSPPEREQVNQLASRFGFSVPEPTTAATLPVGVQAPTEITFGQAHKLRTSLLEMERKLKHRDPAFARQAIPAFRDALDQSIEKSITAASPVEQEALAKWRGVNKEYGDWMAKVYGPAKPGGKGNPIADTIEATAAPEQVTNAVTKYPSAFRRAETAVSPKTAAALDPTLANRNAPDPMDRVRRAYLDRTIGTSRVDTPISEDRLISPRKLETTAFKEQNAPVTEEILGPTGTQELRDAIRVGKAIHPRDINPSSSSTGIEGISQFHQGLRAAAKTGAAAAALGGLYMYEKNRSPLEHLQDAAMIGAGLYAPRLIAKKLVKPISLDPEKIGLRPGGAVSGAIGRILAEAALGSPSDPDEEERQRRIAEALASPSLP